jgi:molybdopterin molybdotransferase
MLTVEEARERVLAAVGPLDTEPVTVGDALGRVVAADVTAPHPLPRFDNSAMDGYALRAADTAVAPAQLRIVGEVRAGEPGNVRVERGTAVRIMTGAPLPEGADAVCQVELTEEHDDIVLVREETPARRHVRPAGDDIAAGALVVAAGDELGPGELALLASLGRSPITVFRIPRVVVLVTGDELVSPEQEPGPGQIRDSNGVALRGLVAEAGAVVVRSQIVPDGLDATLDAFRRAADEADLVVSSGGVAVGKYDYVKEVVEKLGRIDLWRVAMQPGKPIVLGALGRTPFLGLPGNPVSIHVGFEQFVRPALRRMSGCSSLLRPVVTARLTEPIEKPPGRLHFVRVRLSSAGDEWWATPTGPQGSHIQSSLVGCHGVARFAADETKLERGAAVTVEVWRLPGGG